MSLLRAGLWFTCLATAQVISDTDSPSPGNPTRPPCLPLNGLSWEFSAFGPQDYRIYAPRQNSSHAVSGLIVMPPSPVRWIAYLFKKTNETGQHDSMLEFFPARIIASDESYACTEQGSSIRSRMTGKISVLHQLNELRHSLAKKRHNSFFVDVKIDKDGLSMNVAPSFLADQQSTPSMYYIVARSIAYPNVPDIVSPWWAVSPAQREDESSQTDFSLFNEELMGPWQPSHLKQTYYIDGISWIVPTSSRPPPITTEHTTPPPEPQSATVSVKSKLTTGGIVGIIIAVVIAVIVCCLACALWKYRDYAKHWRFKSTRNSKQQTSTPMLESQQQSYSSNAGPILVPVQFTERSTGQDETALRGSMPAGTVTNTNTSLPPPAYQYAITSNDRADGSQKRTVGHVESTNTGGDCVGMDQMYPTHRPTAHSMPVPVSPNARPVSLASQLSTLSNVSNSPSLNDHSGGCPLAMMALINNDMSEAELRRLAQEEAELDRHIHAAEAKRQSNAMA